MRILDFADGFESAVAPTVTGTPASSISFTPASGIAATDVQAAIVEAKTDAEATAATALNNHISDATDAHAASAITNTPSGNLAATTVQAALNEIQGDVDTLNAAVGIPAGTSFSYNGKTAPTGYFLEDGSAKNRATYAALYAVLCPSLGTFTVTLASPGVVTLTSHGCWTGERARLSTTGALPTGLTANTDYYIIRVDANTFRLATSISDAIAGTAINTSGSQSGTHSAQSFNFGAGDGSTTFNVPDSRGRVDAGADAMGGTLAGIVAEMTNDSLSATNAGHGGALGNVGGRSTMALTEAQLASHTHIQNSHRHTIPGYNATSNNNMSAGGTSLQGTYYTDLTTATNQNTGSGSSHNNIQPTIIRTKIIKY